MKQIASPTVLFLLLLTSLLIHALTVVASQHSESPRHLLEHLSFFPPCLLAAALTWRLAHRLSGQTRRAWMFFTAGILSWGAGHAAYTWLDLSGSATFPSLADVGYLLLAPFFLVGVMHLWQPAQTRLQACSFLLDVAVIMVAAGDTIWHSSLERLLQEYARQPFSQMVSLAYSLSNLLVVALLLVMAGWRTRSLDRAQLTLLGAGLTLFLTAHTMYAHQAYRGVYEMGGALDLVWTLGFAAFGTAAYVRLRAQGQDDVQGHQLSVQRLHRINLLLPFVALALSYAVLFGFHSGRVARGVDLGVILLFVLLFARQALAVINTRRLTRTLEFQGKRDALTGLLNRASMHSDLTHKIDAAQRQGTLVGVLFLDLDRMKYVNDAHGHAAGDEVLLHLAARLKANTRTVDTIARFGGDEFVLTVAVQDRDELTQVAQRLLMAIAQPVHFGKTDVYVTGSIGIAVCPTDSVDAATALYQADLAMYRAKGQGKNAFAFFEPQDHVKHLEQVRLEEHLRYALQHDTLELHYQPVVRLPGAEVAGFEALLRWTSPELGPVPALKVVQIAEERGLMPELGAWVLARATEQLARWHDAGHTGLRVGVNVTASQFGLADFVCQVTAALEASRVPPRSLVLELTEGALMHDIEDSARKMHALRELGVLIALDDFGTGYSSLSYLRQLPVDILKIDRSFIATVPDGGEAFVNAILTLAHAQGARVVAEGIEHAWQRDLLSELQCDLGQGYHFARPMPADLVSLPETSPSF